MLPHIKQQYDLNCKTDAKKPSKPCETFNAIDGKDLIFDEAQLARYASDCVSLRILIQKSIVEGTENKY